MPDGLTDEQRAAVEIAGSAAVRAGAGSGKTTVLAQRFLHLVRPGPSGAPARARVGEVLAITFTDKAAAEMRRKIRTLVADARIAAAPGDRARWDGIRRELLGAQISTIHAFCARVVRENPLEAGVDPRATVLDEHEGRAWLEAVVEEALVRRLRDGEPRTRALLLRTRGLRGANATGGAIGCCTRLLGALARGGRDGAWLVSATMQQETRRAATQATLTATAARIADRVRERLAVGGTARSLPRLAALWPEVEALLRSLGPETPLALPMFEEFASLLGTLRLGLTDDLSFQKPRLEGRLAREHGALAAMAESRALAALLAEIEADVGERKRADGVLTFDDLIAMTRALFAHHPGVLARYADRFRALLVDEFQDTDAAQAAVVQQLATAAPATTLFVVGDEKQSIYRFRGADVRVFHGVRQALGLDMSLSANFRSLPGVLAFVNALAGSTMQVPADGSAADWTVFDDGHRLRPTRPVASGAPAVRLVTFAREPSAADRNVKDLRVLEARVLAGIIADLHERGRRFADVAVLFRTLNQVKAYEYALRRREIPYYVVKGRGFFQCPEVRDVVQLLAAIADPDDALALAATLRSPMFLVDDDLLWRLAWPADAAAPRLARRFRRDETFVDLPAEAERLRAIRDELLALRSLRSRATVVEVLEAALAATDFEAVCLTQFQGAQKVANVRKLIELARDMERRRLATLDEFVRAIRDLAEREPREPEAPLAAEQDDVVRLMTIHQAKGLEFPVVVLPDLGRQLDRDNDTIVVDETLGLVAAPVVGAGQRPQRHAWLEEYRRRETDRARAEHARLLYVACTRARDELVLIDGGAKVDEGDRWRWSTQIMSVLGRERVLAALDHDPAGGAVTLADGERVGVEPVARYLGREASVVPLRDAPREEAAGPDEHAAVARVLDFAPLRASEIVTTATALTDFRRCPRQYWYRHVLALPAVAGTGRRARLVGQAAHGVLEALDLARADAAAVDAQLAARPETLVLDAAVTRSLARDLLAAARALQGEMQEGLGIVGREVPFVLPLPAARPRVLLQGRIDLLARRGDRPLVRDYKYAHDHAEGRLQYGPQLDAYRLAVAIAETRDDVGAEIVFLRDGPVLHALPPLDLAAETAALVVASDELAGALAGSGGRERFPRRPSGPDACRALGCAYVGRCWRLDVSDTGRRSSTDSAGA